MGLVVKSATFFEFQVVHLPQCTDDGEWVILPTALMQNAEYRIIYGFYFRNVASVFLPFILLVALNSGIVLQRKCTMVHMEADETGSHIRLGFRRQSQSVHHNLEEPKLKRNSTGRAALMTSRWVNQAKARVRKTAARTFVVIIVEVCGLHCKKYCNASSITTTCITPFLAANAK